MAARRPSWHTEASLLLATAVVVMAIFVLTPLDIAAARFFYHPQGTDHWPLGNVWLSSTLYRLAPYITALLLVLGLTALFVGYIRVKARWRESGIFIIFCLVLGPGLLINTVFKDHWDRPRPRDIVEFGGAQHYTPAPWRGDGGSSFPCGHCSVGFLYASGWWVFKRGRPGWARASLALGLILGSVLGLGRMAAGAHFLSDVVWSALFALALASVLSHYLLQPAGPSAAVRGPSVRRLESTLGNRTIAALAVLGAIFTLIALFVTPHGKPFSTQIDLATLPQPPRVLEVTASSANINIVLGNYQTVRIDGELHGFGFFGSRIDTDVSFHAEPIATLAYRIEEKGWVTDLSAEATIQVPSGELQRIAVRLHRGNIRVIDNTRSGATRNRAVQLDLRTDSGSVQQPDDVALRF